MRTRKTVPIEGRRHLSTAARWAALACLAGAALLAIAGPASAAPAKAPCWKLVLNDSYSGHFDTIYPHACYAQAIERIPTSLLLYGDTRDQIKAAEAAAAAGKTYTSSAAMSPPGTGTGASGATSGGSSGVPTAVIVLAGLAGVLLVVGGAGEIWRRTRRQQ